jgi:hypothetical protein
MGVLSGRSRRSVARRAVPFALALAVLASACATARTRESRVTNYAVRGDYIDATFATRKDGWRFLFPRSPECTAVLGPGAPVTYTPGGLWGRFVGDDGTVCEPVGIGNLDRWRRTRPTGATLPSSAARWEIAYRDDDVILLRGRFAVARFVGLAGSYDLIAMVANDAVCRGVAEGGAATLVYRPSGANAFLLSRCPVLAFATP